MFKDVTEVLRSIDGKEQSAIDRIHTAIFHQKNMGNFVVSNSIFKDLTGRDMIQPLVGISRRMLSGLDVELERLAAGSVYLMKDRRTEFETELFGVMFEKLGCLEDKYSKKVFFNYSNREESYIAHFYMDDTCFNFILCKDNDD